MARVMVCLGGRAGEELGTGRQFTGVSNDFQQASQIVRQMICVYGMSEAIGPIEYDPAHERFAYSPETARRIDEETHRITMECFAQTKAILHAERARLDKLAHALLERETLSAAEVYELLAIAPREQHALR